MVCYSFLGDLEGFKMGDYYTPSCSSGTVVVGLLHPPVVVPPTWKKNIFLISPHFVDRGNLGPSKLAIFLLDFFFGIYVGLLHPPCSSPTTTPPM